MELSLSLEGVIDWRLSSLEGVKDWRLSSPEGVKDWILSSLEGVRDWRLSLRKQMDIIITGCRVEIIITTCC
jgi:hypothetical protein